MNNNNDAGRKCKVDHRLYGDKICTFKYFGNIIIFGDDNEPRENAMAFVECDENGEVFSVNPDQVKFIK